MGILEVEGGFYAEEEGRERKTMVYGWRMGENWKTWGARGEEKPNTR